MRSTVAIAAAWAWFGATLACTDSSADRASDDGDGVGSNDAGASQEPSGDPSGDDAPDYVQCEVPSECVPVASTCCACPSFAVRGDSDLADGCAEVNCDPPDGCPAVEAACTEGQCALICSEVATEMVCASGFARDELGCLVDTCADGDGDGGGAECSGDQDCVQVPADCCGCAQGGSDTAVSTTEEAAHLESLDCPSDPACPGVDVCDPSEEPRCIAGQCALAPAAQPPADHDGGPPGESDSGRLCGTPDSPSCPDGWVCLLNHPEADEATRLGVGSCHPDEGPA